MFTMINKVEFSERLQEIIDFNNLSASSFADRIGVQRSSISHILSLRNKPSLDFILKVIKEYPDVELYWLLNGKGSYPSIPETPSKESISSTMESSLNTEAKNEIERIVIFYKDGTFKNFKN